MTDWKELARKHEDSANHYARRCYDLEALNAELVEALESALQTAEFESHPFRPWHHDAKEALAKARGECTDCEGTGKQEAENKTYHYNCLSCDGTGEAQ